MVAEALVKGCAVLPLHRDHPLVLPCSTTTSVNFNILLVKKKNREKYTLI